MSLEISTPKSAKVITLQTLTRVQYLVMIAQPHFSPRMGENANQYSSFPFYKNRHLEFRKSTLTFELLYRRSPYLTPQLATDSPRCLRTPTLLIKQ